MAQAPIAPAPPDGSWKASDGNWYPPATPGTAIAPPAPKKSHKVRWIVLGVIVAVIAIAAATSGNSKSTTKTASTPAASAPAASAPAASGTHKIGDTATTSGWEVTVYGSQDPWTSTNQFVTPAAGSRYVQVDVQVRNTKSTQQLFLSGLSFKMFDSANRSFTEALVVSQPGPPNGQIPAGAAVRGFVTFEVPSSSTGLSLNIQGSLTASGSRFQLS